MPAVLAKSLPDPMGMRPRVPPTPPAPGAFAAAITALDPSRASLGGAIIYMAQIAGGAIGLGVNTAIVVSATVFADGIGTAFLVDSALAVCASAVSLLFIGGRIDRATLHSLVHRHRAHG